METITGFGIIRLRNTTPNSNLLKWCHILLQIGCNISLEKIPGEKLDADRILYSESHSRYLLVLEKKNLKKMEAILQKNKVSYNAIGKFGGKKIQFNKGKKTIIDLSVDKAYKVWINSLEELIVHG